MTMKFFWSPRCRETYKEFCVIYLVRLKYPFLANVSDIELLAQAACLSGYRIYAVYGPEDFVVIAWAQSEKHAEFFEKCETNSRFRSVHRFDCEQSFPSVRLKEFRDTEEVDRYYDEQKIDNSPTADMQNQFVKLGLKIPVPDGGKFRFFTLFQLPPKPPGDAKLSNDQQFIIEIFKDSFQRSKGFHVCVYVRKVDGKPNEFIVETLSESYESYYEELGGLREVWAREKILSVTYVVASPNCIETDEIDTNINQLTIGSRESRLLQFLKHPDAFRAFANSTVDGRRLLLKWYKDKSIFAQEGSPFEGVLRELLLAFLLQDRECLISALTITVKIEGYLTLVLRDAWRRIYQNGWYKKVQEALASLGDAMKKEDPNKLSFANSISVSNKLPECSNEMKKLFGEDWEVRLSSLVNPRNDFAHGRAATDETALETEKWSATMEAICGVAGLYVAIVSYYDENIKKI